jgi:UDP-GlcNAc:undecaprenyl-phosphate GlcNAc-1-phosphate transferase
MTAFVVALAISYIATPYVRRLALSLKIMVQPGGRRIHSRPMPLWGGMAIYAAFTIACLLLFKTVGMKSRDQVSVMGVLLSGTIILIVGLIDDMRELSAWTQALAIVGASLLLTVFGVRIQFYSNPFAHKMMSLSRPISYAVTIAWMFMVTKTIDFMDGLDGLAAGIGAIAAGVLAIMAYYSRQYHVALMAASLSGACAGFLRFNFNPAKIFMGTGGSQFIGFCLAAISIIGAFKGAAAMAVALPVLVLGVPIFDGLYVMFKRLLNKQPIHIADRSHLHHRLMARGLTHKQAVFAIYIMAIALGILAIWLALHGIWR